MGIATTSEQRYRRLFERYSREVYAYCRRRTDTTTAADAAAETFTVAWRRIDDVPDGEAALGWLYGVARRVLANEFRSNRRSRRLLTRLRRDDPPADPTPEVIVVRRERDRTMFEALGRLRPEDQEVLRLAWWEELPHAEIAALMVAPSRPHRSGFIGLRAGSPESSSVSTTATPPWGRTGSCGEVRRHHRRSHHRAVDAGCQPDPRPR